VPFSLALLGHEPAVADTSSGQDDPMDGDQPATWAHDEVTLSELGQALFAQRLTVTVQLPGELARRAVQAWERDDTRVVESESPAEALTRKRAAAVALIGLAVQSNGTWVNDTVTVPLDAWQVGTALDSAEDRGLLKGEGTASE
jgi:hypothetical protein